MYMYTCKTGIGMFWRVKYDLCSLIIFSLPDLITVGEKNRNTNQHEYKRFRMFNFHLERSTNTKYSDLWYSL
jgi:hypothetical protein